MSFVKMTPPPEDQTGLTNFTSRTIACAPLNGTHYEDDRYSVYHLLLSFTTGQPSEDWIKSTRKNTDGQISMKDLRDHFSGEGNTSRNISEAERLRETLQYKNERTMYFETFLTNMEKCLIFLIKKESL